MAKFKVTFTDSDLGEEVIEALGYEDVNGKWIDFLEPDPEVKLFDGARRTKHRFAVKEIKRIDRLSD